MSAPVYPTELQGALGTTLVQEWRWYSNGPLSAPSPSDQSLVGATAVATFWDPLTFQAIDLTVTNTPSANGSAITYFTAPGATVESGVQLQVGSGDLAAFPLSPPFQDWRGAWKMVVTLPSGVEVEFAGGSLWLTP